MEGKKYFKNNKSKGLVNYHDLRVAPVESKG